MRIPEWTVFWFGLAMNARETSLVRGYTYTYSLSPSFKNGKRICLRTRCASLSPSLLSYAGEQEAGKATTRGYRRNPFSPDFFFISLAEFNLERVQLHLPARLTDAGTYGRRREAPEDHRKNARAL